MQIIEIKMKKNKREFVATTFDGENISLTPDAIVKFGITVGEVDDAKLAEAEFDSACAFALSRAMNWLTASYRSESELKRYLREHKYSPKVAEYVVGKLKEYNFLSDENLAKQMVEYGQNKIGVYKIRQKLMEKGVAREVIDSALESLESQDDVCYNMALKKLGNMERTRENMAKVYRYLAGKGFDFDTIKRAFNKLNYEEEE